MNEPLLYSEGCDARTFNTNLKRIFKKALQRNVRVRIVNSYKFPDCYAEVWLTDAIPAEMPVRIRQLAALEVYPDLKARSLEIALLGNINVRAITLNVKEWENVFQEFINNPAYSDGLDRLIRTIDGRYYPSLKSFLYNNYKPDESQAVVNAWLAENPSYGVIKTDFSAIYVADCEDKGEKVD